MNLNNYNSGYYGDRRNSLLKVLLAIAIILTPFMNLPYMKGLMGELGAQGSAYAFIFIIICVFIDIVFINKRIITIKNITVYFIAGFLIWVVISSGVNFSNILSSTFKGRSGISKFILQIGVLGFCFLSAYCVYYIMKINRLGASYIRKFVTITFFICGIYSFMEIFYLVGIDIFDPILKEISYWVNMYTRGDLYPRGVRSISGEASYFAMFSTFALPFLFSYLFTKENKKKTLFIGLSIYILVLMFFSKSRIGYVMIVFQVLMFLIYTFILKRKKQGIINMSFVIIGAIVMGIVVNNVFYNRPTEERAQYDANTADSVSIGAVYESINDENNMSNVARLGLWKAAFKMGVDNPVFGVGLGQYGFNVSNYVDDNAKKSWEVQRWLDPNETAWPPAFSIHFRIFAEFGIIGFILWLGIWISLTIQCFIKFIKYRFDITGMLIITLIAGIMMSGFNADTFGYFPYWIVLGMSLIYIEDNNYFDLEEY
ncbi:O-antigen ligase family protein [Clostridium sp.]|uniref:O-antigen ligase family protein n=1 Tax=Clostridium sp. TaxID=1506 RepID=UPI0034644824